MAPFSITCLAYLYSEQIGRSSSRMTGVCGLTGALSLLVVMMQVRGAPTVLPPDWMIANNSTLSPEQNISGSGYWPTIFSSPTGISEMGFVPTSEGLSTLGIAFIPPGYGFFTSDVIWSANRNAPVGMNATLALIHGNLELRDNDTTLVWSTNIHGLITSVELQDNGNLIFRDASNHTLWDSFSHPTDTLVLGQELGYKTTLIASASLTDNSEGSYKMVVESEALILYTTTNFLQPYSVLAGALGNNYTFDDIIHSTDTTTKAYINYQPDGQYANVLAVCFKLDTCFTNWFGEDYGSALCFLRLDYDGVLRWYYFEVTNNKWIQLTMTTGSTDPCLLPDYCGPYGICSSGGSGGGNCNCPQGSIFQFSNSSNAWQGCGPIWNSTACVNEGTSGVMEIEDVAYVPNNYLPASAENVSSGECREMCLGNCSCAAAFFWNSSATKCFLVTEVLSMYTTTGGEYSAFVKYEWRGGGGGIMSGWRLGVVVSSGGVLVVFVCVVMVVVMRARLVLGSEEDDAFLESLPGLPPRLSFKELDVATKRFSTVLGEGGFGTVYEGVLSDGSRVAVKRLGGSKQGQKEFRAEVATIGGINHLRLVRLWGFCADGPHRMLVYECMEKGSLDRWLFRDVFLLSWSIRYQIAVDTAQGLSYLHHECRHKIIHLDVKPQNILLDNQFRAKVADFGMSKLYDQEMTKVVTQMRGTPGYLAPEWLLQAGVTVKCDVYSYGMVLLEIVSGRKNLDVNTRPEKWYFPAWALQRLEVKSWIDIVDFRLESTLTVEDWAQVKKVVKIAIWCIQESPHVRPTMATVVQMLEGVVVVDDPPPQYDFLAMASKDPPVFISHSNSYSIARSGSSGDGLSSLGVVEFGSFCNPDSTTYVSSR